MISLLSGCKKPREINPVKNRGVKWPETLRPEENQNVVGVWALIMRQVPAEVLLKLCGMPVLMA